MINGVPFDTKASEVDKIIDSLLDSYKNECDAWKSDTHKYLAKKLALNNSINTGKILNTQEMNQLVDELFACETPFVSIHNKPTVIILEMNELLKQFK